MNDPCFQNPDMLHLLGIIPLLLAGYLYAGYRRRRARMRFVEAGLWSRIQVAISPARRGTKAGLVLVAMTLIGLALARPGWNPQSQTIRRQSRDVVFLLDASRSMLADDLAPNRLERAKLHIADCLERLNGEWVGLVVFAGAAVVKCPLTSDYDFLRTILDEVTTDTIGHAGTAIGDAIRKSLSLLRTNELSPSFDLILITDGEDHESFPVQAAEAAGARGVRILAIGLGDDQQGRRIPARAKPKREPVPARPGVGGAIMGLLSRRLPIALAEADGDWRAQATADTNSPPSFLTYQGREVRSKLNADLLRQIAGATPGGEYFDVGTGTLDLGEVYQQVTRAANQKEFASQTGREYTEGYPFFLAGAVLALTLEGLLSDRRSKSYELPQM